MNYPWCRCSWDFGSFDLFYESLGWRRPDQWQQGLAAEFRELKSLGISVLRWWILGDGRNYPDNVDQLTLFDRDMRVFRGGVPRLSRRFTDDFGLLLRVARDEGLMIMPSLISFEFCDYGRRIVRRGSSVERTIPRIAGVVDDAGPGREVGSVRREVVVSNSISRGRFPLIAEPSHRREFLQQALGPLVEVSSNHPGSVYAWELINEPEWVVRELSWLIVEGDAASSTVSKEEMRQFILDGVEFIVAAGFPATVGFAHHNSISDWEDSSGRLVARLRQLALTPMPATAANPTWSTRRYVHQLHHYGGEMPLHEQMPIQPCLVGEFGTAPPGHTSGQLRMRMDAGGTHHAAKPWTNPQVTDTERQPHRYLYQRLRLLRNAGFPGAFLWSAQRPNRDSPRMRPDTNTEWTLQQKRQVWRFATEAGLTNAPQPTR